MAIFIAEIKHHDNHIPTYAHIYSISEPKFGLEKSENNQSVNITDI